MQEAGGYLGRGGGHTGSSAKQKLKTLVDPLQLEHGCDLEGTGEPPRAGEQGLLTGSKQTHTGLA